LSGARRRVSPDVVSRKVADPKLRRRRLALGLGATLFTLLLIELLLRLLVLGNLEVARFVRDPGDGRCVGLEPGVASTYTGMLLRIPAVVHSVNEYGYRGPPRARASDSNRLRIVALGDSFTFGQGVEDDETLPAALERELRARSASGIEVLNFGVPGLNLSESIDQYRHFASRWEAEVVVLFLFENDLDQSLCELLDRRVFMGLVRHVGLVRLGVVAFAPHALGAPNPHASPARVELLREQLGTLRELVAAQGARLIVVSLADPLADAAATREVVNALEIPALVFEREQFESYETIVNESHWTVAANREVAAVIAGWMDGLL
jgi:lysophospholipase L1-like esterase